MTTKKEQDKLLEEYKSLRESITGKTFNEEEFINLSTPPVNSVILRDWVTHYVNYRKKLLLENGPDALDKYYSPSTLGRTDRNRRSAMVREFANTKEFRDDSLVRRTLGQHFSSEEIREIERRISQADQALINKLKILLHVAPKVIEALKNDMLSKVKLHDIFIPFGGFNPRFQEPVIVLAYPWAVVQNRFIGSSLIHIPLTSNNSVNTAVGMRDESGFPINPHYSNDTGSACLGGFDYAYHTAANQEDWFGVLFTILDYNRTVDKDDAWGSRLNKYEKIYHTPNKRRHYTFDKQIHEITGIPLASHGDYYVKPRTSNDCSVYSTRTYARCHITGDIHKKKDMVNFTSYVSTATLGNITQQEALNSFKSKFTVAEIKRNWKAIDKKGKFHEFSDQPVRSP